MNKKRINTTIQLGLLIVILIVVNLLASGYFARIDLTKEKRFTVSDIAVQVYTEQQASALLKVYFAGEMPTRYKLLQDAMETYLTELNLETNGQLEYDFIDPSGNEPLMSAFIKTRHYPFTVTEKVSATENRDRDLLPYAVLTWLGKSDTINLIRGCVQPVYPRGFDINVEKAIQNFEYNIVTSMYNLTRKRTKVVGLLQGHNEYARRSGLTDQLLSDIERYYTLLNVYVKDGEAISPSVDVLLVMKPDSTFTEREVYEIDQYVMRGGKVLWVFDQQVINWDVGNKESTMTQLRDLNLDYMFLKYGVKVNYDIVQDLYSGKIDLAIDQPGYGTKIIPLKWVFHPEIQRFPDHPVTRNLDNTNLRFASSIDTTYVQGIQKEVFMMTSDQSRTVQGVQYIDVDNYIKKPVPSGMFNKGPQITGLVIRGNLPSVYRIREAPIDSFAPNPPTAVKLPRNVDTLDPKIAIISDGEFGTGQVMFGKIGKSQGDNIPMILNLLDYLSGSGVLSEIRAKEVVVRQLDKQKFLGKEGLIQIVNLVIPILLVIAFGLGRHFLRIRKNKKFKQD